MTSGKSDKAPDVGQPADVTQKTESEIGKVKALVQMPLFVAGKVIHITWEPVAGIR